tara:strand:- start:10 stop:351 length:342 start_codon:yes stop_codon:yes gene_type:complete
MDILLYFIIFYLGIQFGELLTTLRIRHLISKIEMGEIIEEIQGEETEIKKLITEQINDVLYLYNHDTKDFICQGSSIEELAKMAKEYKNINLAAVIHNEKLFLFNNGTCKEHT